MADKTHNDKHNDPLDEAAGFDHESLFETKVALGAGETKSGEPVPPLMAADDHPEDTDSPKSDPLNSVTSVLGDGTPLAISGAELMAREDGSLDDAMNTDLDCVEVARLKYLSEHDELTGQKNRLKLHQALEDQIIASRKNNLFCSFVVAAIDNLSVINETFGYQLGDEVISAAALRLARALRKHDVIGRYSSNKFGIILPRCGPDALHITSSRLLSSIADEPVQTSQGLIPITLSLGGVVMPQFASNAQEAISRSLEALDNTKKKSTNGYVVYEHSSEKEQQRKRNLAIADDIISALNEGRMHLSLQPIVCAKSTEIVHYECLIMMEDKNGAMISAGEFLPIAEKLGLCRLIDYRTLELAVDHLKQDPTIRLTLNVSGHTAGDANWLIVLRARAGREKSVLQRLMVEITETVSIRDIEETASFVASLRELGCSVAIDDFGAGYSSYRNLRKLDVDVVKIDGEFVRGIATSKDDQIFVASLVNLAKAFDMKTVAEWVNDEATARYLREAGVDYLQGFMFGKPQIMSPIEPADETKSAG